MRRYREWFLGLALGVAPTAAAAGICWFVYKTSVNSEVAIALAVGLIVGFFVGRGWGLLK